MSVGLFPFMATEPKVKQKRRNLSYLNNPSLKAIGVQLEFTGNQVSEYARCSVDPIYFIENYAHIVSLDRGSVLFKLYPYQKRIINAIHNNRMVVAKLFRQAGKSSVVAAYIAWYVLFNKHKCVAILANKQAIAREIFSRVQFIIEHTPLWLQEGIKEWNKTSFELENGSSCFAAASSPSAVRGMSINFLLCDEFAHLNAALAEEFIASVFPTISASDKSKLILVSTPKGRNAFHKIWSDAEKGINGFVTCDGHWTEHPERNQKWADEQKAILGEVRYQQEVETSFVGSSFTLISGAVLSAMSTVNPVFIKDSLQVFAHPLRGHAYVATVDTSEGVHMDYSAMVIFDITTMPYKVVATYKDNTISSLSYPFLIMELCKKYNDAYILVETNSVGGEVANTLLYELEYEYVYYTHKESLNEGMGHPGVRTTKKVKAVGTGCLRDLIEQDQLIINSHDILSELSVFVKKGVSYASSDPNGINDDLTSCLWLFAWLTKQPLFAELTDTNVRAILAQKTEEYITENLIPFGHISTGREVEGFASFEDVDRSKISREDAWILMDIPDGYED